MELQVGNKVFAKKVFVQIGNAQYEYSAPRGKSFAMILMGDEDPKTDGESCDNFLNSLGWAQVDEKGE